MSALWDEMLGPVMNGHLVSTLIIPLALARISGLGVAEEMAITLYPKRNVSGHVMVQAEALPRENQHPGEGSAGSEAIE